MCILSLKIKLLTEDFKVKNTKIMLSPKNKPEHILQKLCIPVKDQIPDVLAGKNK